MKTRFRKAPECGRGRGDCAAPPGTRPAGAEGIAQQDDIGGVPCRLAAALHGDAEVRLFRLRRR